MGKSGKRSKSRLKSYTVRWVEEHSYVCRANNEDEASELATQSDISEHRIDVDNYSVIENEPMFSGEDLK